MVILLAALSLFAQDPMDEEIDCRGPLSDPEMAVCWGLARDWEEARMQRYYLGALEAITRVERARAAPYPSQARAYVTASQATWKAYAFAACQGVYENFGAGTARNLDLTDCEIDMMRERTYVLWRDYLEGSGDWTGDFPEPTRTVREEWRETVAPADDDSEL